MPRADAHTRVVGWLKVALPLVALAILATLFLLADRIDPDAALPYAEVDVKERAREPRMTAPSYAGTTSDGAALTLTAAEARTATEATQAAAEDLLLTLNTPDGAHTELRAVMAAVDTQARQILLSGGVEISTSSGYLMTTEGMRAKLDRSGLESTASVTATGPAGTITAEKVTLGQDARTPATYLLVFKGAVRLIYQPGGTPAP